jgi:NitT/TauT family transport system permease protein
MAWGLRAVALVVLAVWWELSTSGLRSLLVPTFSQTMGGLVQLFRSGQLWQPLLISNQALLLGYLISILLGVPLGLAMSRFRTIDEVVDPYASILLAFPIGPIIPIVIMAMGLGLASQVVIVVLFASIFIVVNTRAGVRNVDRSLIEMAGSFGASERKIWLRILIPGAMPAILAGLRIGLGRAVTGMVLAELLLVATGVGRLMLEFRGSFQKELLFAVVLVLVAESVALMGLMRVLEQRLVPWTNSAALD